MANGVVSHWPTAQARRMSTSISTSAKQEQEKTSRNQDGGASIQVSFPAPIFLFSQQVTRRVHFPSGNFQEIFPGALLPTRADVRSFSSWTPPSLRAVTLSGSSISTRSTLRA
jgi:hypothetical protein